MGGASASWGPPLTPQQQQALLQQQQAQQQQAPQGGGGAIGTIANLGGQAGGHAMAQALMGGGGTAPAAPELVSAGMGSGASGPASPALLETGFGYGPTQFAPAAEGGMLSGVPGMSYLGPLAVAGLGAYTASTAMDAHKAGQGRGIKGGLKAGIKAAGPLNYVPVLGQAAWLAGLAGGAFGGKKHAHQRTRDLLRSRAIEKGYFGNDYKWTNTAGGQFDFGKDDGARLPSGSRYYNFEYNGPDADKAASYANIFDWALGGRGGKTLGKTQSLSAHIANALTSGGDITANAKKLASDAKASHGTIYGAVHKASEEGTLDKATADAYKNALDEMYGVGAYAGGKKPKGMMAATPKPSHAGTPRDNNVKPSTKKK